jgi:hypothetical protein
MRLRIGERNFKYKKDASAHYKEILNSYGFGNSLSDEHYNDILDLIEFDYQNYLNSCAESSVATTEESTYSGKTLSLFEEELDYTIVDVKIGRAQFNTKCFEICYAKGENAFISYIQIFKNKPLSPIELFLKACRNSIQQDLINVKQRYFDDFSVKGKVKCQETDKLSFWEELVVDHRQPNTFSIIADRFKEVHSLQISELAYSYDESNLLMFKDTTLLKSFRDYHKSKATLRIVRKEQNLKRSSQARVKAGSKDLQIN